MFPGPLIVCPSPTNLSARVHASGRREEASAGPYGVGPERESANSCLTFCQGLRAMLATAARVPCGGRPRGGFARRKSSAHRPERTHPESMFASELNARHVEV